jgi:hypothetical protein
LNTGIHLKVTQKIDLGKQTDYLVVSPQGKTKRAELILLQP